MGSKVFQGPNACHRLSYHDNISQFPEASNKRMDCFFRSALVRVIRYSAQHLTPQFRPERRGPGPGAEVADRARTGIRGRGPGQDQDQGSRTGPGSGAEVADQDRTGTRGRGPGQDRTGEDGARRPPVETGSV